MTNEEALFKCWELSGADLDGNTKVRNPQHVVEDVAELRKSYDEACEELYQLDKRFKAIVKLIANYEGERR